MRLSRILNLIATRLILSIITVVLLPSCSGTEKEIHILEPRTYPFESGRLVDMQLDSGQVTITNGESGQMVLSGEARLPHPDDLLVTLDLNGVTIRTDSPESFLNLNLQVPTGTQVKVHTYNAEVIVQDFSGNLDVTSAAGDILIDHMEGLAVLRVNRGDVLIEASQGEFHLPGNYGLLSLTDVSGIIEASTIMGTIRYRGRVDASDQVKLETDHGPVEAWLNPDSDVTVVVRTTTGVVDCVIPGLSPQGAGCAGRMGTGEGLLQVRTVSGEVDLESTP